LIGAVIGLAVGYAGKCRGGTCPLTCNPVGGVIVGLAIGLLFASSMGSGEREFRQSEHVREIGQADALSQALAQNDIVLVDFYADWCGPCKRLKPTLHALADAYAGRVAVVGVNVESGRDLASEYGVESIPDVRIFHQGEQVARLIGARPKRVYVDELEALLGTTRDVPEN